MPKKKQISFKIITALSSLIIIFLKVASLDLPVSLNGVSPLYLINRIFTEGAFIWFGVFVLLRVFVKNRLAIKIGACALAVLFNLSAYYFSCELFYKRYLLAWVNADNNLFYKLQYILPIAFLVAFLCLVIAACVNCFKPFINKKAAKLLAATFCISGLAIGVLSTDYSAFALDFPSSYAFMFIASDLIKKSFYICLLPTTYLMLKTEE